MKALFQPSAENLQHLQVGPIGPHLSGFAEALSRQGYSNECGWLKVRLVAKLSRWLGRKRIPVKKLNEELIAAFLKERWKRTNWHVGHQITMDRLLRHLRQVGVIAEAEKPMTDDVDVLVWEYECFLLKERSLFPCSADRYLEVARRFLSDRFPKGKVFLKRLQASDISDFLLRDTSNRSTRSTQLVATTLRSFLNFLFQKARIGSNLAAVVPPVHHRPTELPRYLSGNEVEMVLRSCDRRRKTGKRNYAIFLLLARLGLRAGEVTQLTLDDIDWQAGELLVRGKGARVDRLPLLDEVGKAIVEYLKRARPSTSSRRIFIQCKAPYEGFAGPQCVSNLVRVALIDLGLSTSHRGAHVLRHSLATGLLGNGASLAQIGQVLRHQLPQTTEIYAKVDFAALRPLALPWMGGVQ